MDSTFCGGVTACVDVEKNIQAIQCKYGNPSWFITIAPADLPNVIGHVGNERATEDMKYRQCFPESRIVEQRICFILSIWLMSSSI